LSNIRTIFHLHPVKLPADIARQTVLGENHVEQHEMKRFAEVVHEGTDLLVE